ncbi:glutathione peroxidase [Streptococcus plurextorum]|uniref:glutathione peroxidase n=1 Tax=Streptococcus plurextorum TaxID=456876 RepID=UPI0004002BCE|nr:glutathione peroxidase [Streptococcus plurextorum]
MANIYDFSVENQDGSLCQLSDFFGKVLLVVNTATGCGLTPQYQGLQALYDAYHDQGFEVLDFPCNQFKQQASGTADDINTFCTLHYQTTFPRFAKIEVNGKNAHPLYQWMKEEQKGAFGKVIEWNFTKFLINREGQVIKRFAPTTTPDKIATVIEKYL